MAKKQIVEDDIWKDRIASANRYYDKWSHLFKCDIIDEYYEGRQWRSQKQLAIQPYVINKIFETVQIKIAQFVPTFIKYLVQARPGNSQFDLQSAAASSQLKEDVLNTLIWDNKLSFHEEIEMAYKESFFRFGIIEVGYEADWIINPNAPKPVLMGDVQKNHGGKKSKIKYQPPELPINERVYFKHVGAKRFRVGGIDNKYLHRCGWVGYWEWVDKDEILSYKIMNKDKVEGAQSYSNVSEYSTSDQSEHYPKGNQVKLWRIWDIKNLKMLLVLDSPCTTIWQKSFKRLPLFDLRPDRRVLTEGFYPVPPVYHWLSPQDEINEIRDMLRNHRRRFVRKYAVLSGGIDDDEIEKFETGPDGALIKVNRENAIQAIDAPDLGQAIAEATVSSGDDLNQISGTSDEVRGVADRTTATQANIINQRATTREGKERDRFVDWVCRIGEEVLILAHEKFSIGIWARLSSGGENFLGEVQENQQALTFVHTEDLNDGYDFRIDVDVTSLSASAQQEEKQKFLEFLSITSQFPQIGLSPKLIREAAYRVGYRNESVIREMQKMALLQTLGAIGNGGPQGGANTSQQIVQNQTPPNMEQARNQLQNQLGVTQ